MTIEFKEEYINDIVQAQMFSWKKAFKGILSKKLLSNLVVEDFEENWRKVLKNKERENFIWLNEENRGLGFISYGKPKDKKN